MSDTDPQIAALQDVADRAAALADLLAHDGRPLYNLRSGTRVDVVGQLRETAVKAEIELAFLDPQD